MTTLAVDLAFWAIVRADDLLDNGIDPTARTGFDKVQISALLIGVVLPLVVGLVTRRYQSSRIKAVLLLAMSALTAFITEWANSANFVWQQAFLTMLVTFGTGIISLYGFLRPTGLADAAQDALGGTRPPPNDHGAVTARVALATALLLTVPLVVTALAVAPAHAAGWSGKQCDEQPTNDAKVCVQVYVYDPAGPGISITAAQVCTNHMPEPGTEFDNFRGTHDQTIQFRGANGDYKGFTNMPDTPVGECRTKTGLSIPMGLTACYSAYGRINLEAEGDPFYSVKGAVDGGPATC